MDNGDREQIQMFEVSEGRSRRCWSEGVCYGRTEIEGSRVEAEAEERPGVGVTNNLSEDERATVVGRAVNIEQSAVWAEDEWAWLRTGMKPWSLRHVSVRMFSLLGRMIAGAKKVWP